mmetsp:Transcript_101467/g.287506  ORF Transcript_101467/g.287506 Transcript_101467/m.287506 type:complete len:205 (+) Transcript_101467:541-1155(+)
MKAISSKLIKSMDDFDAQELSNTAWAIARFSFPNFTLLTAISAASRASIGDFKSQNLNNPAWSMAVLGICDQPLMNAIASSSLPTISDFNMQGRANTVWAYDNLGCDADVQALLESSVGSTPSSVDAGGSLSWTDYGGVASTRCAGEPIATFEAVVRRDILEPLLRGLASLTSRARRGHARGRPLRLELLRGAHQVPAAGGGIH